MLEQHYGIVGKVVSTYCWHPDDRDELTQEVLTQLWRAFPRYDDSQSFSTWMYRVALNVSISWVRRHSLRLRHTVTLDDDLDVAGDIGRDAADDERIAFLRTFIEGLDTLNRALMLLYLEERSYKDIAVILGISETNVATKISRLKQRVRKQAGKTDKEGTNDGTR
ncbi:MAG: sigma-70 family RNA polymerase sigma factor [Pseudomonadota bacterium]